MNAKKGKYSKQIYLGKDKNGKQIRKRVYADTKEELYKKADSAKEEWKKLYDSIPSVTQYAAEWLAKKECGNATRQVYENLLSHIKRSEFGKLKMPDVETGDVQMFINEHNARPNICKKLKLYLNNVFEDAVKSGVCAANPTMGIKLPKQQNRSLTVAEIGDIKKLGLNELDEAYALTMYHFGLKPCEALALQKTDFNWDAGLLTVSRAIAYPENSPVIKNVSSRSINITKTAEKDTRCYIESQCTWVFTNNGGLITKSSDVKRRKRINAAWEDKLGTIPKKPWCFSC